MINMFSSKALRLLKPSQSSLKNFSTVISNLNETPQSNQILKSSVQQTPIINSEKQTKHHGHYRFDQYSDIRRDKKWQQRIIKREDENFERWVELTSFHYEQWRKHVFGRGDPEVESIPEKYGNYIYFLRHKEYSQKQKDGINTYEIYCRHDHKEVGKFKSLEEAQAKTEIVLDLEEVPFVSQRMVRKTIVDKVKMNDDHSLIAFTIDIGNTERLTGGIKDMKKNEVLKNIKLEGVSQIEFGRGHDTIFYVETDQMNRPYKVKKLNIVTNQESTVFVDPDQTHYVDIGVTKDGRYLVINSNTKEDSEVWVVNRDQPDVIIPTKLIPRRQNVRAHIDHLRDFFVMITNHGVKTKNYKLTTLQDDKYSTGKLNNEEWEDLVQSTEGFIINEFDGFKDFIAIYIKNEGRPEILIQDLDTKSFSTIPAGDVGEIYPGLNQDYESQSIRYSYSSPFIYSQVFDYYHNTKSKKMLKEYRLRGSPQIIRNEFDCKQFLVPSHDGETIPLNVYFKKGMKLDRKNRVLLEGYGAYGLSLNQGFNIVNTSAMEKGWVIAQAMVRGGGEKGIYWHEQGKLNKKPNSFKDFIACAEFLIANRITHPNLLAAKGSSAGGTLVAQACYNMNPELFRACVLNVPFLDVLSTLLDETLPLTATDHLELGNPVTDEKAYSLISSYSPYENLAKREYPATLMNVSLTDPRVPHWGTLKFVEKLRDVASNPERFPDFGNKNIVVRFNKDSGHFGTTDNEQNLAMATFEFAWLDYIMFKKHNI